jgi:hypothetical protein
MEKTMAISFNCIKCGKEIKAPDSYAGKQGKCPYCGQGNNIPMPVDEDDLIPLAPIDENEERRRQQEIDYLRSKEKLLLRELSESSPGPDEPAPAPKQAARVTIEQCRSDVMNYCLDLANSRLDKLDVYVSRLKNNKALGMTAVEDFMLGRYIEPALDDIPPKVLKGFLTQMREALR